MSLYQCLDKRGARGAMAPPEFSESSTKIAFAQPRNFEDYLEISPFPKSGPPEFGALSRHCLSYELSMLAYEDQIKLIYFKYTQ